MDPGEYHRVRMLPKLVRSGGAALALALFPDRCAFCGTVLERQRICARCRAILPWIRHACSICGQPLPGATSLPLPCADCQQRTPVFDRGRAPLVYAFPVDTAIQGLKFRRQLWLGPAFAELLEPLLEREFPAADALLPVPLHRWRQARRGFNQATEICLSLARASGLRIVHDVKRTRATQSQSGLSATERRRNMRDAFGITRRLGCRRPVIVDDVMTTGATCSQLAEVLLRAGAASVGVLTVARATTNL